MYLKFFIFLIFFDRQICIEKYYEDLSTLKTEIEIIKKDIFEVLKKHNYINEEKLFNLSLILGSIFFLGLKRKTVAIIFLAYHGCNYLNQEDADKLNNYLESILKYTSNSNNYFIKNKNQEK